ncbi:MAG: beta galactosidase jelly roll domain-containing protein, partial [Bacteroidales bacterium]|nr:beta galactosidase jelly roll domain-containing protein [Bacteroidales bacterium]
MKHFIKWQVLCCLMLLFGLTAAAKASSPREVTGMDKNWKFMLGNPSGAEAAAFDDSGWRTLDVPHDWSAEGQVDEQNPTGSGGAYFPAGIGWYRKTFDIPANWKGKQVFIEFDGIMANSEVWINGVSLGKRPYGYIVIRYDMTPHLKFGAANVLAVKADNADQPASRWYAGAGIYRHTRMIAVDPVHVDL